MKHDHKKTKKLKVALFSMFMFLPFIAIGITCLTHVFNKEVTEETETATINYMYETNEVNSANDIIVGKIYNFNVNNETMEEVFTENTHLVMKVINGTITTNENLLTIDEQADMNTNNSPIESNTYINIEDFNISIRLETLNGYIQFAPSTIDEYYTINANVVIDTKSNLTNAQYFSICENIPIASVNIETNPQDQTTNIFYDSCTQVEQSFILNWCNTTNPLRTTLNNFTQIVGLPNEHLINSMLTYWLSITIIYIIIDIIIEIVIYLTHMFNKEV